MTQWRKIESMSYYRSHCKIGYGSYIITLDCGHRTGKKMSQCKNKHVGSRVKCIQCPDAKPPIRKADDADRN